MKLIHLLGIILFTSSFINANEATIDPDFFPIIRKFTNDADNLGLNPIFRIVSAQYIDPDTIEERCKVENALGCAQPIKGKIYIRSDLKGHPLLKLVLVHEAAHVAFVLQHSHNPNSIMYPELDLSDPIWQTQWNEKYYNLLYLLRLSN